MSPFIGLESLVDDCLQTETTASDEKLMSVSENLIEEANNSNNEWNNRYFDLVSALQEAEAFYKRYIAIRTKIDQLSELIHQYENNIVSVKEIFKNRLKSVPTAYLLLVKKKGDIYNQSRAQIDSELADLAKRYLGETFSPSFVTSHTLVKDLQVVQDVIISEQAGRIESFESDPVRQMTEDQFFFLLQKYRIYPEFGADRQSSGTESVGEFIPPGDFEAIVITDPRNQNIPNEFKVGKNIEKLVNLYEDVEKYNSSQTGKVHIIDNDYNKIITDIRGKKRIAEIELASAQRELTREYGDQSKKDLQQKIMDFETKLNEHVREREMTVITVQSELSQRGERLNDLYAKMVKQAYEDLMNRASQLTSYKFFVVENNTLRSQEAHTFYSHPTAVAFDIPLRRRKYIPDEGGVFRCGVILALKVKFVAKEPEKKPARPTKKIPVSPEARRLEEEAYQYMNSQQYEKAIRSARQAYEIDSTSVDAMKMIGISHYFLGNKDEARLWFIRAQKMDPTDPDINKWSELFK